MSDLLEIFKNQPKKADKWNRYFPVYDECLAPYKGKNITAVEVGVADGGSLEMWSRYFGAESKIFGIDVDQNRCGNLTFDSNNVKVFIGDQGNKDFLEKTLNEIGPIDVFIDDGGHFFVQQVLTLQLAWKQMKDGGIFIIEDTHTSYMSQPYNMGLGKTHTFIEWCKPIVDALHYGWVEEENKKDIKLNYYKSSLPDLESIQFFDSMVILKKRKLPEMQMIYSYK